MYMISLPTHTSPTHTPTPTHTFACLTHPSPLLTSICFSHYDLTCFCDLSPRTVSQPYSHSHTI